MLAVAALPALAHDLLSDVHVAYDSGMSSDDQIKGRVRIKDIPTFDQGLMEPDWYEFAACRDAPSEWFFPYSDDAYLYLEAEKGLAVCNEGPCPVRDLCLEHAVHFATYGIWGGKTANQIKQIRRERKLKTAR